MRKRLRIQHKKIPRSSGLQHGKRRYLFIIMYIIAYFVIILFK